MKWPTVKLYDICRPRQWKTISSNDLLESGYPVYGANGKTGFYSEYTHEKPTLMITCRGATCGNVHISEPKSYINGNAMALDNLSYEKVDMKYLYYFMLERGFKDIISGSAQPQITRQGLTKVEIPLPPLEEQKRIATILDKADAIRRKRQQAIQLADDFLRAVFLDMFGDPVTNPKGWPIVELSALVDPEDRLNYGVVQPGEDDPDGVPLIRSGDLSGFTPNKNQLRHVSSTVDHKHRRSKLKGNEILIACVGSIGRVGWVTPEMAGWNIARAVTRIPVREGVNREYLYRYLQSPVVQSYFERETRAVAQPTLNVGLIAKTPVMLPPIEIQNEFLKRYEVIKKTTVTIEISLQNLNDLIGSLSQKAFRGEL